MVTQTESFVRSCWKCQINNNTQLPRVGELIPIRTSAPGEIIASDIKGTLPVTRNNNKYFIVIIDHFSKFTCIKPLINISAEHVSKSLVEHFFRFGLPSAFLSDQGRNYQAALLNEVFDLLDIQQLRSSAFHPEGDGVSERLIQSILSMMTHLVNEKQDDWDEHLPAIEFALNTFVHSSTGFTPWELQFGRKPKLPIEIIYPSLDTEEQDLVFQESLVTDKCPPNEIKLSLDKE